MSIHGMNSKSYLENHLGYRLFLTEIGMREVYLEPELSMAGMQMSIKLCNAGYGAVSPEYKVFLSLDSGKEQIFQEIQIPEIYYISNGQTVKKQVSVKLPKEFLQGSEKIVIGLKIARDEGNDEDKDCVQLANEEFIYHGGVNEMMSLQRVSKWLYKVSE